MKLTSIDLLPDDDAPLPAAEPMRMKKETLFSQPAIASRTRSKGPSPQKASLEPKPLETLQPIKKQRSLPQKVSPEPKPAKSPMEPKKKNEKKQRRKVVAKARQVAVSKVARKPAPKPKLKRKRNPKPKQQSLISTPLLASDNHSKSINNDGTCNPIKHRPPLFCDSDDSSLE